MDQDFTDQLKCQACVLLLQSLPGQAIQIHRIVGLEFAQSDSRRILRLGQIGWNPRLNPGGELVDVP